MGSSAKKIATNTIVMYVRMLFLIVISFVSSRYLLKTLGIEDYGIYSVVGSVVATFVSLKSLFSESIQRFLNYEKGKESLQRQEMIYTISVIIHILLAVVFVILVEVVGIWLINNKLVIPVEKLHTALFVFHYSVLAMVLGILSIPYDALVIANEKMTFYAIVSIFDGALKLVVIMLIPFLPFEYLKTYAVLIAVIHLITLVWMYIYCKQKFPECKLSKEKDNKLIRDIFSLSGWNFFGNLSFSLLHEGINFLLNTFGGLVLNAARSIAYQVRGMAVQFNNNTLVAVRPSIMQSAAVSSNEQLYEKILLVSRISFFSILVIVVPIIVYCDKLLSIWLVEVPEHTALFTQFVLLSITIRSLHEPLNMLYMSLGKIKKMMIIETIIMIVTLLVSYINLKLGASITSVFVLMILMELIIILLLVRNAKSEFQLSFTQYMKKVLLPMTKVVLILMPLVLLGLFYLQSDSIIITLLYCILYAILTCVVIYLNMTIQEEMLVHSIIKKGKSYV